MGNYLRTKKIVVGDREITVKEFSIASQTRFEGIDKITFDVCVKESLSEEDYVLYCDKENVPHWLITEIDRAIKEVNARPDWLPKLPEVIDNKPFREITAGNKEVDKLE